MHVEESHWNTITSLLTAHFFAICQGSFITMMPVGNNKVLVHHLSLNERNFFAIQERPHHVLDIIFVPNMNVGRTPRRLIQDGVDASFRIFIQHEDLFELGSGMAEQFKTILLWTGQGPLMGKNNLCRVVFELPHPDKSFPNSNLSAAGNSEALKIDEECRLG